MPYDPIAAAERDGHHSLAHLIRLRAEAAAAVERLLHFLDDTAGAEDLEDEGLDEDGGDSEPDLVPMVSRGAA